MASSSSWTEVNLSKWATNYLSDSCNWECLEYPQRVGESTPTLKVLKVHVRGCDATATKSKKGITAIYEIRMTADVKVTLPIDKGKSLCEAKGEISVPCVRPGTAVYWAMRFLWQIDSVDAEDGFRDTKVNFIPSMNYQPGADENLRALMCSLLERCKQDLPLVVRRALVQFDRRIKEEASNLESIGQTLGFVHIELLAIYGLRSVAVVNRIGHPFEEMRSPFSVSSTGREDGSRKGGRWAPVSSVMNACASLLLPGAPTLGPVGAMTGATADPLGQFKPLSFNGGPGLSPPVVRRATEAPPVHRAGSQFGPRPPAASLQNTPRLLRGDCNPMFFSPSPRARGRSPCHPSNRACPFHPHLKRGNDPLGASRVTTSIGPPSIGVAREATAPSSRQFFAPMTPLTAQPAMGLGAAGREVQGRVVRRIRIGVDGTVKSIEDLTDDGQPRQAGSIEAPAVNRAATASLPSWVVLRTSQVGGARATAQVESGGSVVTTSVSVGNSKPPLAPRFQPISSQTQSSFRTSLTTTTTAAFNRPAAPTERTRVQARVWGAVSGGKIDSTFQAGASRGYVYEEG
ncbi:hypothetical protein FOZ60_014694 [Perkinsus olseni]|uniref:Uncharacterized protein n=1 Tax=Perkinsus olseni TaxID=32597 RepID=A0A7J6PLA8_PEROL|nr:hypothetical protein FOZ60_014694 [Perkinsus olseni]